ncbi:MAG: nitronate monooxygenase [Cyanobacteria bacterium SID2]|nr:nitronate monooxygenase [Cyanobacteria bacterium SID2]MBP0005198.1 nitronate monooxygenase [Cyanobacteria bacterium SBC]
MASVTPSPVIDRYAPPAESTLPSLQIGKSIARVPIIQGGMGVRISGANLAGAVANAGGVGIISAVGLGFNSPYYDAQRRKGNFFEANRLALIDELRLARSISSRGVIGVNIMVAARDFDTLVKTAAEHGANLIVAGAGLPMNLPELTQDYPDVALVPIVSSTRAAKLICRKWKRQGRLPDAFIVENPRTAGGHLGASREELDNPQLDAECVVPELVEYLKQDLGEEIPVIAAGGVWDRADIDRSLALGAKGVQMGTRFITTEECDADIRYKQVHLDARPEDVVLVPSPVGLPGRAITNDFAQRAIEGTLPQPQRCVANCLKVCKCREKGETYCILKALDNASRGNVEDGLIFSGSNAGRATQIVSVAELITELTCPPQ